MTIRYFPFDSGAGSIVQQADWQRMAQHYRPTSVLQGELNAFAVSAISSNMNVTVATGRALIQGFYFENDAIATLTLGTADATNPRIDRIILRVNLSADTITQAVLQGTPGASPSAPALTQSSSVWEISLAQVRVNAGVSSVSNSNVTDERRLSVPDGGLTKIAETLLAASAASIDFTSIPQIYRHLLVVFMGRGSNTAGTWDWVLMQFNADSGSNYDSQELYAAAAVVTAAEGLAGTAGHIGAYIATANAGVGSTAIWIPDYTRTAWLKAAYSLGTQKQSTASGGTQVGVRGVHWRSTAVITQVSLLPASGTWNSGTMATLYGLAA